MIQLTQCLPYQKSSISTPLWKARDEGSHEWHFFLVIYV